MILYNFNTKCPSMKESIIIINTCFPNALVNVPQEETGVRIKVLII